MRRVQVLGTSGSGKTTLARALAQSLGVPHIELDALFWKPDWVMSLKPEMEARTAPLIAGASWVIDGNYSYLQPAIWAKADTLIWLDLPFWRNLWNVTRRGIQRVLTREPMWGHSRETVGRFLGRDSLLRWVWTTHKRRRERHSADFARLVAAGVGPRPVRLQSYREAAALLEGIATSQTTTLIEKVLLYVVRERAGHREVLAFTHPQTGLVEVVRGTVKPGEGLAVAAARELREESGVEGIALRRFAVRPFVGDLEFQLRHAFAMTETAKLLDTWEHRVFGEGDDKDLRFRFHWVSLKKAPRVLEPGACAFLKDLEALLTRLTAAGTRADSGTPAAALGEPS